MGRGQAFEGRQPHSIASSLEAIPGDRAASEGGKRHFSEHNAWVMGREEGGVSIRISIQMSSRWDRAPQARGRPLAVSEGADHGRSRVL